MSDWTKDAHEFGLHVKQGGWRLGLLVARNVEKDNGHGARTDLRLRNDRYEVKKVSATRFAEESSTSTPRVLRYWEAWERAADAGYVPHAADLTPNAEPDLDVEKLPGVWESFFRPQPSTARNDRLREQAEIDGAGPAVTIAIASNPRAVAAAIKAYPEFAQAVVKDRETRGAVLDASAKVIREAGPRDQPRPAAPTGIVADLASIRITLRKIYDLASHPTFDWGDSRATIPAGLRQIAMQAEMVADAVENPNSVKFSDDEWAELSQ